MLSYREKLISKGFTLPSIAKLDEIKDEKERERVIELGPDYFTYIYPNELDKNKDRSNMGMLDYVTNLVMEDVPSFIEKYGRISDYELAKRLILINPNAWYFLDSELQNDQRLVLYCQPLGGLTIATKRDNDSFHNINYTCFTIGGFDETNYPEVLKNDSKLLELYLEVRKNMFTKEFISHPVSSYRNLEEGYDLSLGHKINIYSFIKQHLDKYGVDYNGGLPTDVNFGSVAYVTYDRRELDLLVSRIDLSNPKINKFEIN